MTSTEIEIGDRVFYLKVYSLANDDRYYCMFHERNVWFGRVWGFKSSNKNYSKERHEEVYRWFKRMVEKHIPADESGEQVLDTVVERLQDNFEEVEVRE